MANSMANAITGDIHKATTWSIVLSVLMIAAGVLAIFSPAIAGVAVTAFFGWLLIFSGILHLAYAWQAGRPGAVVGAGERRCDRRIAVERHRRCRRRVRLHAGCWTRAGGRRRTAAARGVLAGRRVNPSGQQRRRDDRRDEARADCDRRSTTREFGVANPPLTG